MCVVCVMCDDHRGPMIIFYIVSCCVVVLCLFLLYLFRCFNLLPSQHSMAFLPHTEIQWLNSGHITIYLIVFFFFFLFHLTPLFNSWNSINLNENDEHWMQIEQWNEIIESPFQSRNILYAFITVLILSVFIYSNLSLTLRE